ncbi:calcium homeostasis modulator protein 2-like [Sorex araneus]|uniref:calcium homeostasis modulator protein 2-like n=1 Tax=Sorex araneus TaxID=42254 RepID=UPI0024339989|nr:calcium homeostasis modulator protein 2-like [Sorex araneus]XP_054975172.1 calcium homeostasis modulator protein 2-like [Sorex araneus]
MANPIVRFLSHIFRSKDLVTLNVLVALGTMGGQELFSLLAFQCPCSPVRNFRYGLTATLGPALLLFFISIILNNQTRNLVDGCRCFRIKQCPCILYSIMGRALVAPLTWLVISLLRGDAYVCAFSEFVDPSSLTAGNESFPLSHATQILARFPCGESPDNLSGFREEVSRRLKYESQLLGWLLICTVAVVVFLTKCLKACSSRLGYQQEAYWARYLANEEQLFQRTAEAHSLALAANNVKQFFGFVALSQRDQALMAKFPKQGTQLSLPWDNITGISEYQEMLGIPLYSRLHKWANRRSSIDKEFNMTLLPYPQPQLAASPTSDH